MYLSAKWQRFFKTFHTNMPCILFSHFQLILIKKQCKSSIECWYCALLQTRYVTFVCFNNSTIPFPIFHPTLHFWEPTWPYSKVIRCSGWDLPIWTGTTLQGPTSSAAVDGIYANQHHRHFWSSLALVISRVTVRTQPHTIIKSSNEKENCVMWLPAVLYRLKLAARLAT